MTWLPYEILYPVPGTWHGCTQHTKRLGLWRLGTEQQGDASRVRLVQEYLVWHADVPTKIINTNSASRQRTTLNCSV